MCLTRSTINFLRDEMIHNLGGDLSFNQKIINFSFGQKRLSIEKPRIAVMFIVARLSISEGNIHPTLDLCY